MGHEPFPSFFVYGSLRPDDDSGQSWTKKWLKNLTWHKAKLPRARLYKADYAFIVLEDQDRQPEQRSSSGYVVGYVVTASSREDYEEKLQYADEIEGTPEW
jgi:hypothetical protein